MQIDVFAVVSAERDGKGWRVAIYCDENVPLFGPSLPCPPVFEDPYTLREFLLVKLINGEKATFNTPTFAQKRERTLDALLRDMYQEHSQESKSNVSLFNDNISFYSFYRFARLGEKLLRKSFHCVEYYMYNLRVDKRNSFRTSSSSTFSKRIWSNALSIRSRYTVSLKSHP